jgi:hypothetical protein
MYDVRDAYHTFIFFLHTLIISYKEYEIIKVYNKNQQLLRLNAKIDWSSIGFLSTKFTTALIRTIQVIQLYFHYLLFNMYNDLSRSRCGGCTRPIINCVQLFPAI